MSLLTSLSNIRRLRFLLYFFVPVALALVAGATFNFVTQKELRSGQVTAHAKQSQDLEAAARHHRGLQVRKPVHHQVSGPRREQARLMRPHVRERPRCPAQAMLPLFVLRAVLRAVQAQPQPEAAFRAGRPCDGPRGRKPSR